MIDVIIYSKNRACQLDACLESLIKHFPFGDITISYKWTSDQFFAGYMLVSSKYDKHPIHWMIQDNIKSNTLTMLRSGTKNVLVLCDDFIFTHPVDTACIERTMASPLVNNFNPAMGMNITHCYAHNKPQRASHYKIQDDVLLWRWRKNTLDWGYPNHITAAVYKRRWMRLAVSIVKIPSMGYLEGRLSCATRVKMITPPYNASFVTTKAVGLQVNQVQTDFPGNRHGKLPGQTLEALNDRYLHGERINVSEFYGKEYDQVIIEPEFTWVK